MSLIDQTMATPLFSLNGRNFAAKCLKVYDGDTCHMVINFNNEFHRFRCRLNGIDTAEIKSKDIEEKAKAQDAKKYLSDLILDKIVTIQCGNFDKYGRLLVDIFQSVHNQDEHINKKLIDDGYARPYFGGKK